MKLLTSVIGLSGVFADYDFELSCNDAVVEVFPLRSGDKILGEAHYADLLAQLNAEVCEFANGNDLPSENSKFAIVHGAEAATDFVENFDITEYDSGILWLSTATPRKFYLDHVGKFPMKSASLMGTLDGIERISRLGEELYHTDNYVGIVEGMNHNSFTYEVAPDGTPDGWVLVGDLKEEISQDGAITSITEFAAHFMDFCQRTLSPNSTQFLWQNRNTARDYLEPSIAGFNLENSFYYGGKSAIGPDWDKDVCPTVWRGDRGLCESRAAPWGIFAQEYVSGFYPKEESELVAAGYEYIVDGWYAALSSRPSDKCPACLHHLPFVYKDGVNDKKIYNTIFTQTFWDSGNKNETYASAETLHTKIYSRQCTYRVSGYDPEAPYSLDDAPFCQEINQIALENAIEALTNTTILERYQSDGIPFEMEADKVVIAGPSWLDFGLKYEPVMNGDTTEKILVQARSLKTPADFPVIPGVPDAACYHYCHLLSPARIMEWIYTDSL